MKFDESGKLELTDEEQQVYDEFKEDPRPAKWNEDFASEYLAGLGLAYKSQKLTNLEYLIS
ncbi:MAG: hypothetical protein ACK481_06170 [Candidatus Melainabacteria bacterium]|jgi:hypothetical protein